MRNRIHILAFNVKSIIFVRSAKGGANRGCVREVDPVIDNKSASAPPLCCQSMTNKFLGKNHQIEKI